MLSEEHRNIRLGNTSLGYADDECHKVVLLGPDPMSVDPQKDQRGGESGSLVAVDERVVAGDMKKVGRCHLMQASVKELLSERSLRHGDRGLQKSHVTNSAGTAVSNNLIVVDGENLVESKEMRAHYSASLPNTPA